MKYGDKTTNRCTGLDCVNNLMHIRGSFMALTLLGAVFVMSVVTMVNAQSANMDRLDVGRRFPYQATSVDVEQALNDMSQHTGLTLKVSDKIDGSVSIDNSDGSVATFLDDVVSQVGGVWWSDGFIVHIEPQSGLASKLIMSQGLSLVAVKDELDDLGLLDKRFPLTTTRNGAVIRVVGPDTYVAQVESLIGTMIRTRRAYTSTPEDSEVYLPKIFHGRGGGAAQAQIN